MPKLTIDGQEVEAAPGADPRLLVGREPVVRPDPLDEVVHVRLEVGPDLDVDRARRAGGDQRRRGRDPVSLEERPEDVRPVVPDP